MKTAMITGVAGQDGFYLSRLLLEKGYRVCGTVRPGRAKPLSSDPVFGGISIAEADLADGESLNQLVRQWQPDELYHLAAESFLPAYRDATVAAMDGSALGTLRLLEALRAHKPDARFFLAGSSEMFGKPAQSPQTESTPLNPVSLYGIAKVFAHSVAAHYRRDYGLFTATGFLFNHESPRRPATFVTRKITQTAVRIRNGLETELRLGNMDARRDWAFAGDFARGMWLMLQQPKPDDFILATGKTHSVREFCDQAFTLLGLNYEKFTVQDASQLRPNDHLPVGDPGKAARVLGWKPEVSFEQLVKMMVDADLQACQPGRA